jgi:hypothetical protein
MSMLNIGKRLNQLRRAKLHEAKADTQRLIDFAGQDLADRFNAIKNKLKAPENDLYYWIKNKTVQELEQAITNAENEVSKTKAKKDVIASGAKVIHESEHWTIYSITSFEAAQTIGRDTRWCITGVNDYGDKYWKDYTNRGITFYFAVTNQNYDPRGEDSKFAFAVYPNLEVIELFNQVDERVNLEDIPYYEEIKIPGVDLNNVLDSSEDPEPDAFYCDDCGRELADDEYYLTPDGEYRCESCFYNYYNFCEKCGESFDLDDMIESVYGEFFCYQCWDEYLDTEVGHADLFVSMAETHSPGEFTEISPETLAKMIKVWSVMKARDAFVRHDMDVDRIERLEQNFIRNAAKDGITINPADLNSGEALQPIAENELWKVYRVTNRLEAIQIAKLDGWTDEQIEYSDLQAWKEDEIFSQAKIYLICSKHGRPTGYSGNDVGVYMLMINPDGYFSLQEDQALWCDAYPSIQGTADLDIDGFRLPQPDKDGMFYTQEGKHKVLRGCDYKTATGLKNYTVAEGTTKIGAEALYDASNLEILSIPSSVIEIGDLGIPEDNNFTDFKVICKKGSYAETYCKENNIPVQVTETLNVSNKFIEANSLANEIEEYDNMWDHQPLTELKRYDPSVNQTNSTPAQQTLAPVPAQPPVKLKKRKQVKNKFGILVDDWREEFSKLAAHIWTVCQEPVDEKDSSIGPSILRLYFGMPSGEEWRLEVTTTKVDSSKGLKMIEYWDYVLSADRNGSEVIISRGHVADYNEFLDILLKEKIIKDKKRCA